MIPVLFNRITTLFSICLLIGCKDNPPEPNGSIQGKVTVVDTQIPIEGISINLTGARTSSQTTGSTGTFELKELPVGDYTLTISESPSYRSIAPIPTSVRGNSVTKADFSLTPKGTISGKVSKAGSTESIPGASVELKDSPHVNYAQTVTANKEGFFSFEKLLDGKYSLTATHPQYETKTQESIVKDGNLVSADIALSPKGLGCMENDINAQPDSLNFGTEEVQKDIELSNICTSSINISINTSIDGSIEWLMVNFNSDSLQANSKVPLTVNVSRVGLAPGSYKGKIIINSGGGIILPVTIEVELKVPNQPPSASFNFSTDDSLGVNVDASKSFDPDINGQIVDYMWQFGDGESGFGEKTKHTYEIPGEYTIELIVKDVLGAADTVSEKVLVDSIGTPKPDMVLVQGGTYKMGDNFRDNFMVNEEGDTISPELPVHNVAIDDFHLGTHEVSFDEFVAFTLDQDRDTPDDFNFGRGKRPVISVSWYDAIEYCNWLSQRSGYEPVYSIDKSREDPNNDSPDDSLKWIVLWNKDASGYRLPTEAEWEYAAREKGEIIRFGNGKDIANPEEINFDGRDGSKQPYSITGIYRAKSVEIESFEPNQLGLFDMSGNVAEWCWDWYDTDYYERPIPLNPPGPEGGTFRVTRGGSWARGPIESRASSRGWTEAVNRRQQTGFRLARSLK